MMSSPVQECSGMENDRGDGAAKLSKSQKKNRRKLLKKKLNASSESVDKREDTENSKSKPELPRPIFYIISQSSIPVSPNTVLGTTATINQKRTESSTATTGAGKSSMSKTEGFEEIVKGEKGSSTTTTVDVKTGPEREENMEVVNDMRSSSRKSTCDVKTSKREEQTDDGEMGCSSAIGTRDSKNTVLKREQHMKIANGETVSSGTAIIDANTVSKRVERMETASGEMVSGKIANDIRGSSKKAARDVKLSKRKEQTDDGKMGCSSATHDAKNRVSKREQHMKIANGDSVSSGTGIVNANTVSKREDHMETASGETLSGKIATPEAKMVSKGEEHRKDTNGEMGSSVATNLNLEGMVQKKKKQSSRKEKPTSSEVLDPRHLDVMETTIDEMGSGTTATDNTASKKKKRQKLENKNSTPGDISSARESTQDMLIAKKGSSTPKVLEAISGKTVSGKTATPDPKIVSKGEERTKVASGGMGNLNVNDAVEKKKKVKSKKRKPTIGESLNPRYLQNRETANGETGSGTTAIDKTTSKKKKRQKIKNKKPASGDILSTGESTQDTVIAKNTVPEREQHMKIADGETVLNGTAIIDANTVSKREEYMETASGEMVSGKIATPDAKMVSKGEKHKKVANGEMGSSVATNLNVEGTKQSSRRKKSTSSEILDPQHLDDEETTVGEKGSGTTATDNTASQKRKRQKLKSKNSAAGDIVSAHESTQDMIIAQKDSSTSKVLETMIGETVSVNPATPDAKIVSKGEERTKVVNGEMGSSTTTNLNTNDAVEKKKKRKPTIGEILNPRYLQGMETANGESGSGTTATDNTPSKKRKRPEIENKKPVSGTVGLNTHEDTEVKAINEITHVVRSPTSGKKLLIFDVNGLLADIVSPRPKDFIADKYIPRRAIFKRPFLDDFLRFCFERFHVGIWSSRTWKVLDPVVDFLLGYSTKKLLFLWDASNCTNSGIRTLEDNHKCIVFKDLRKVWDKNGPRNSWVKGTYNELNTLLLDDSPYKALLNPKHTGVFPVSYSYRNVNDDFLGPKGGLRTYLEGLAAADNVKTYVEQHPFGQRAIDEKNPNWAFYSRVLKGQRGHSC